MPRISVVPAFALVCLVASACAGEKQDVPAWPEPKLLHEFYPQKRRCVGGLRISPDGRTLCAGTIIESSSPFARSCLQVIDLNTFENRFGTLRSMSDITSINLSPDNRLIVVDAEHQVVNAESGSTVCKLEGGAGEPSFISNDQIAGITEKGILVFDSKSGRLRKHVLQEHDYQHLSVSPNMEHLAALARTDRHTAELHVISTRTFEVERRDRAPDGDRLAWSGDSELLFVGGDPPETKSCIYAIADGRTCEPILFTLPSRRGGRRSVVNLLCV